MERDAVAELSRQQPIEPVLALTARVAELKARLGQSAGGIDLASRSVAGPSPLHAAGLPT